MTIERARLTCDHLEELMYLHEVWPKLREWKTIQKAPLVVATCHPHLYTKNPLGHIPCFFVVANNKYQKSKRVHVPDSFSLVYQYMNNST